MHRKHRVIAGTVAAIAALSLAACSASSPDSTPTSDDDFSGQTLTVLVAAAGAGLASQYEAYYSTLAEEFEKETGATLEFQYYANGAEQNTIVQTSLVSNSGPDVIGYGSSAGATFYATDGFVTLTDEDWDRVGGRDAWNESTLSASGPDADNSIGVPSFSVPYVIAYNTDMFEKAGIDAPPTTWDEWIDVAKRVQEANPGVYGAGFDPADATDPWKFIWSYTHQLGGTFASKDGTKATLDSDEVETAVDFYFSQLYDHEIVPPESLTWNNAQMTAAFTSGKVAMIPIATRGVLTAAQGTPVQDSIAFAQLPSVPAGMDERPKGGTPAASIVSGQFWAIFKYAEDKKDLALELAKVSNEPAVVATQYEQFGWAPTTKEAIADLSESHPEAIPFLDIQKNMEATEFTPAWSTLQTGITTIVNKVAENLAVNGSWDESFVSSQLASAQDAAQAVLK